MALVLADRVRETSTTVGTGAFTLAGAVSGFQSFAVVGNANNTYYTIVDAESGSWEVGVGTYTAVGAILSRDTVLASSTGSIINFTAGVKDVFVTYPAAKAVYEDLLGDVSIPNDLAVGGDLSAVGAATAGGLVTGGNFNNTDVFYYNARTIDEDKTIAGTENVMSVGPISIADTKTVTIEDGGEWVIV